MKKILLFLMIGCIISLSCTGFSFAADVPADMQSYIDELEILFKLDILTADKYGYYAPDTTVTRKDVCHTVARMLNLSASENFKQVFADVNTSTMYAAEIYELYNLNIVSGKGNGFFEPDTFISFDEILAILVRTLGYENVAAVSGGFPYGYYNIANKIGLLDNIDNPSGSTVTKQVFAQLVHNAASVGIYDMTGLSSNGSYEMSVTDETFLSLYHNVGFITGTVDANSYSQIGTASVGDDSVSVDSFVLKTGSTDIAAFLGYTCDVYFDEESKTVLAYRVSADSNVKVIKSSQEPYYENGQLKFYKDTESDDYSVVKIPSDVDIIYNNKKIKAFSEKYFNITDGEIVVSDKDSNGSADVVIIKNFNTLVVDFLSINSDQLYLKDKSVPVIDLNNIEYEFRASDGSRIDETYVKEWGVLSCLFSEDKDFVQFYLSTEKIVGRVEAVGNDEIEVNGISYKYTDSFTSNFSMPAPGENLTFCLTTHGYIAASKKNYQKDGINFGYITGLKYDSMPNILKVKVLTTIGTDEEGKFITDEISSKILVDGQGMSPMDAYNHFVNLRGNDVPLLITFSIDSEHRIKEINTLYHGNNEDVYIELYESFAPDASYTWRSGGCTFDGAAMIEKDALVFYVPADGGGDDDYDITNISTLINDKTYEPEYKTYKLGYDSILDSIVVFNKSAEAGGGSYNTYMDVSVITQINKIWNKELGEQQIKVSMVRGGSNIVSYVKDETVIAGLAEGDVAKVSYNPRNEIDGYRLLFDNSENKIVDQIGDEIYNSESFHSAARNIYGYVYRMKDGALMITKHSPVSLDTMISEYKSQGYSDAQIESLIAAKCEKHRIPDVVLEWDNSAPDGKNSRKISSREIYSYADFGHEASRVYIYSVYSSEEMLMTVR